jgi:hypothetical protein
VEALGSVPSAFNTSLFILGDRRNLLGVLAVQTVLVMPPNGDANG